MPMPERRVENGYKGVEIRMTEKLGFYVVRMSHNVHRFVTSDEARQFVDECIRREREMWR